VGKLGRFFAYTPFLNSSYTSPPLLSTLLQRVGRLAARPLLVRPLQQPAPGQPRRDGARHLTARRRYGVRARPPPRLPATPVVAVAHADTRPGRWCRRGRSSLGWSGRAARHGRSRRICRRSARRNADERRLGREGIGTCAVCGQTGRSIGGQVNGGSGAEPLLTGKAALTSHVRHTSTVWAARVVAVVACGIVFSAERAAQPGVLAARLLQVRLDRARAHSPRCQLCPQLGPSHRAGRPYETEEVREERGRAYTHSTATGAHLLQPWPSLHSRGCSGLRTRHVDGKCPIVQVPLSGTGWTIHWLHLFEIEPRKAQAIMPLKAPPKGG